MPAGWQGWGSVLLRWLSLHCYSLDNATVWMLTYDRSQMFTAITLTPQSGLLWFGGEYERTKGQRRPSLFFHR